MNTRRDILLGGVLLAASGSAYALTPRRKVTLLGQHKLDQLIPSRFAGWKESPSAALVVPKEEDSLEARLYSQSVGRVYANPDGEAVMMLIAYGDTQSDQLQLHRPETCYPAFGFELANMHQVNIPVGKGALIPARTLTASSDLRTEQIVYWTRIGEYLPSTGREQRWMRLRTELSGIIPDGVLVRISTIGANPAPAFALNRRFAADLLANVSPAARRVLAGTSIARKLSA
jgi:EpsI family protein